MPRVKRPTKKSRGASSSMEPPPQDHPLAQWFYNKEDFDLYHSDFASRKVIPPRYLEPNFFDQHHYPNLLGILVRQNLVNCMKIKDSFYPDLIAISYTTLDVEFEEDDLAKQEELWNNTNRFHYQIRKEQDMIDREIQEIRKNQINQTLMSSQKANAEKNLEQAVEGQARELEEMKKQLNQWTRNASAREAYSCWAHQQANPNLSEIPINHIPDLMQTNAEKGRPMFYGALKSHVGTSASSQSAQ
ncbi:hypothetical protein PIB30_089125 [Stylosanthes scabra]|uniref:Uncharacterized protein n=1 Tax=Stylosanthes scabra TaxID=79078 RepID=A0ABU6QUJ2_9FABA|nr:hypothetical protein [Stylosanthes scabra]